MSKEEILGPHIFDVDNWNEGVLKSDAYEAMDKYAEAESTSFAEWIAENTWTNYADGVRLWRLKGDQTPKTTAELYSLFKQQSKH